MTLTIIEIDRTFDSYDEIATDEAKEAIRNQEKCIFVTPIKGFRDNVEWLYPKETSDFFKFVNSESEIKGVYLSKPENILSLNSIDACLPLITIGFNFVQTVGLDGIIKLIVTYLKFKYRRILDNSKNKVKFSLQIEKSDKKGTLNLSYDGPADKITETFNKEKLSEIIDKL